MGHRLPLSMYLLTKRKATVVVYPQPWRRRLVSGVLGLVVRKKT